MVRGTIWSVLQAVGDKGLIAILTLVLARMLGPEEIGVAAVATGPVMIVISALRGFSDVVVRAEEETPSLLNAVFWVALAAAVVGAILTALIALGIWGAREDGARLVEMACAASVAGPLAALAAVPEGLLARRFQFRALFLRKIVGALVGVVAAIAVVALGGGGWSLVAFLLVSQAAGALAAVLAARWRVTRQTAFAPAWHALTFSGRLFTAELLYQIIPRALELACGAISGLHAAGVIRISLQITEAATNLLHVPVGRMLFSIAARLTDDVGRVRSALLDVYSVALFAGSAACATIFVAVPLVVDVLLGAGWDQVVIVTQVLCLIQITYGVDVPIRESLKARGEVGRFLLVAILASAASVAIILSSAMFGVYPAAVGYLLGAIISATLSLVVGRGALGLKAADILAPLARQLGVLAPALVVATFCAAGGGAIAGMAGAAVVYLTMSWILQRRMMLALYGRLVASLDRAVPA